MLTGKLRGEDVELWDADLDGTFTGPHDFLRLGDGAYQPIPADGLVTGPLGLATLTLRKTADGATATFVPEPIPPDVVSSCRNRSPGSGEIMWSESLQHLMQRK